jgi:peroxiredoxin
VSDCCGKTSAEEVKPYGAPRYAKMRRYLVEGVLVVTLVTAVLWWSARDLVSRGEPAPPLSGNTASGETVSLETLRSAPDTARTLVYFYAPWCGVCKISATNAGTVARWLGASRLRVVAVALDYEKPEDAVAFATEHGLTEASGIHLMLATDTVRDAWRVEAYPTYYVLDSDGRIRFGTVGYSTLAGMLARAVL